MRRAVYFAVFATVLAGAVLGQTLTARAQGREIVVPSNLQGTLVCAAGDTLLLGGPDTLPDFLMCVLSADRHLVPGQQQNYNPNNPNYAFRWAADTVGTHRLTLDYVLENHSLVNDHRLIVDVRATAPATFGPLPAQFYGAAAGKDLPVTVQFSPDFHATRVDFFLDGVAAGSVNAAPFAFALPLGGVLAGPHRASMEALDSSGDVYISPVQTVEVANGPAPGEAVSASAHGPVSHAAAGIHGATRAKRGAGKGKVRQRAAA